MFMLTRSLERILNPIRYAGFTLIRLFTMAIAMSHGSFNLHMIIKIKKIIKCFDY